ncbi:DUF6292 family protein [Amycolatopsis minnesotensis]|uniref:DUF6292 family protein n=1 Tax=Amycolatopsis minnesotensis TaxID=337894 RepID=A0ABN2RC00_9PSEU
MRLPAGQDSTAALRPGLAGYLRAVAVAVGVPSDGTSYEISDTATAYLALARRWPRRPGHDLMLEWGERTGWALAVETAPAETAEVLAYLGGGDVVPPPEEVARFVTAVIAGAEFTRDRPAFDHHDRHALAGRLAHYAARSRLRIL